MLMDEYFGAMKGVLEKVEQTQREAVLEASAEIAERLARGGAWHIMDTGHMLMFEGVGRTGGMMAVKPIRITCEIQNPVRHGPRLRGASWATTPFPALPITCWAVLTCCRTTSL